MSKRKYKNIEEIDPETLNDISELQKKHYLALGYRPYRLQNGRTKWLTNAQLVYKTVVSSHRPDTKIIRSRDRRKRRKHSTVLAFLAKNWLILSLVAISISAIIIVMLIK